MRTYEQGKFYEFAVEGIVKDDYGRDFIYLSDGEIQTYRVKPYDFQIEWESANLPSLMKCYVRDLNARDLPYLEQCLEDVLKSCYPEEGIYTFKILSKSTDTNTDTKYLELNDAFGLIHRLYLNNKGVDKEVGDEIKLQVCDIKAKNNNKAYLNLVIPESVKEIPKQITPSEIDFFDPRTESDFGFEGDDKEFKSSIVFPAGETEANIDKQLHIILKTIAGFQNKNGGELYIGVNDSGNVCGIHNDFEYLNTSESDNYIYRLSPDGYELKIRNTIKHSLGSKSNSLVSFSFDSKDELIYCCIKIEKSNYPIFVYPNKLYERAGNMTQLLKGNEITFFIEKRFSERTGQFFHRPKTIEIVDVDGNPPNDVEQNPTPKNNKPKYPVEIIPPKEKEDTSVWRFLLLYKNGGWAYSKKKSQEKDIAYQIQIPNSYKKEVLVIAYANGRINVVAINDLLNPKRNNNRRKQRPLNKRYETGWNTETEIINIFIARTTDLLVFYSITSDQVKWVKIHHLKAISVHSINAQGNILINDRLNEAEMLSCCRLSLNYHHLVSGLILKDHQTSGYLGYRLTEPNFKKSINVLSKILEVDS